MGTGTIDVRQVGVEFDEPGTAMYTWSVHWEETVAKEKILTFVEARARLSEIVDRVSERGETFVVAKRQKPVAVIIGIERYRQMAGAGKYLRNVAGKRILKIGGIAKVVGDVDETIRAMRRSRLAGIVRSL